MALVYIRPDADVVDGSWINESASNTNLYDSLNETSPIDTDYIRSSNNPANDIVTLRLSNFGSVVTEPMTVHYRYKAVSTSGDPLSLKVRLVQGAGGSPATTVAEWEHSDAAATYQDASQLLTTAQFNAISDFDDLFLEFEAITGALGAQLYAYGLLTGENNGFAIDATVYDVGEEAYVGGPIGGTLAVKGHTTNYTNVALDAAVLTQAGTSPKMVHFPTSPYVRWTPHNLIKQSQTFTINGTPWDDGGDGVTVTADDTTAPDGTATADKVAAQATGTCYVATHLSQGITILASTVYTFSVYAKAGTISWVELACGDGSGDYARQFFNLSTGATGTGGQGAGWTYVSSSATDAGNGWYRCQMQFTADSTSNRPYFVLCQADTDETTVAGEYVYLWGAQLNRGSIATPYLVTTTTARIGIPLGYDIAQGQYGVLIEPAATNLQLYSQQIDGGVGSWTEQNITASINATAPDGSTTATTITASAGNAVHNIYYNGGATGTDATHTSSLFVKQGTAQYVQLADVQGTDNWIAAVFDLTNGTVTEVTNGTGAAGTPTATITSVGNGWYRITLTGDVNSATHGAGLHIVNSGTPTQGSFADVTWNAAGTETVLVWGYQLELGSIATSYIPTIGSTATRALDKVSVSLSSTPHSATANTLYVDYKPFFVAADTYGLLWILYLAADAANERISYYKDNGNAGTLVDVVDGGGVQATLNFATITSGVREEITGAWAANDFDFVQGSGVLQSDGAGTLPTLDTMNLGRYHDDTIPTRMFIYRLAYVPRQVETEG